MATKIRDTEKHGAIKNLTLIAQNLERGFEPARGAINKVIERERADAYKYCGRSVFGKSDPPKSPKQLTLF